MVGSAIAGVHAILRRGFCATKYQVCSNLLLLLGGSHTMPLWISTAFRVVRSFVARPWRSRRCTWAWGAPGPSLPPLFLSPPFPRAILPQFDVAGFGSRRTSLAARPGPSPWRRPSLAIRQNFPAYLPGLSRSAANPFEDFTLFLAI